MLFYLIYRNHFIKAVILELRVSVHHYASTKITSVKCASQTLHVNVNNCSPLCNRNRAVQFRFHMTHLL